MLAREALKLLTAENSCRVVCDVASTTEIGGAISINPKLGAQSADNALTEAVDIRKLWPDSKIILLYEHASPADFQKLLTSQIDGCVPLLASPHTLIDTLEMIVIGDVRVMVSADAKHAVIQSPLPDESHQSEIEVEPTR